MVSNLATKNIVFNKMRISNNKCHSVTLFDISTSYVRSGLSESKSMHQSIKFFSREMFYGVQQQNIQQNRDKKILVLDCKLPIFFSNNKLSVMLSKYTGSENVHDLLKLDKSPEQECIQLKQNYLKDKDEKLLNFLGDMFDIDYTTFGQFNKELVSYFNVGKPHNNLANFLFDCLRKGNYATIETVLGIETARICKAIIEKVETCEYDAFVIPGNSSNIPPLFYETPSGIDIPYSNASPHQPAEYSGEYLQSTLQVLFNICTYAYAVKNNKPIAGVCNGLQIMAICNNYQLAHNGKSNGTHFVITFYDNLSAAKTETFSHAYSVVTVGNQKCRTQLHHGLKDPDGHLLPQNAIGYLIDEWGNHATQNHSELSEENLTNQTFLILFGKQIRDRAHV